MLGLLMLFAKDLIIPEVLDFIKKRQAATGQLPTVEEVQANFVATLTGNISKGQTYLDTHPAQ